MVGRQESFLDSPEFIDSAPLHKLVTTNAGNTLLPHSSSDPFVLQYLALTGMLANVVYKIIHPQQGNISETLVKDAGNYFTPIAEPPEKRHKSPREINIRELARDAASYTFCLNYCLNNIPGRKAPIPYFASAVQDAHPFSDFSEEIPTASVIFSRQYKGSALQYSAHLQALKIALLNDNPFPPEKLPPLYATLVMATAFYSAQDINATLVEQTHLCMSIIADLCEGSLVIPKISTEVELKLAKQFSLDNINNR